MRVGSRPSRGRQAPVRTVAPNDWTLSDANGEDTVGATPNAYVEEMFRPALAE